MKNRIKALLLRTAALEQARKPAAPPVEHLVNDDPEHVAAVLQILADVGVLADMPNVVELLPAVHAEALAAAAFATDPAERAKQEALVAAIERLLPGPHSLQPSDLVAAEQLIQQASIGAASDSTM